MSKKGSRKKIIKWKNWLRNVIKWNGKIYITVIFPCLIHIALNVILAPPVFLCLLTYWSLGFFLLITTFFRKDSDLPFFLRDHSLMTLTKKEGRRYVTRLKQILRMVVDDFWGGGIFLVPCTPTCTKSKCLSFHHM